MFCISIIAADILTANCDENKFNTTLNMNKNVHALFTSFTSRKLLKQKSMAIPRIISFSQARKMSSIAEPYKLDWICRIMNN